MATPIEHLLELLHHEMGTRTTALSPRIDLVEISDSLDWVNLLSDLQADDALDIRIDQALQRYAAGDLGSPVVPAAATES